MLGGCTPGGVCTLVLPLELPLLLLESAYCYYVIFKNALNRPVSITEPSAIQYLIELVLRSTRIFLCQRSTSIINMASSEDVEIARKGITVLPVGPNPGIEYRSPCLSDGMKETLYTDISVASSSSTVSMVALGIHGEMQRQIFTGLKPSHGLFPKRVLWCLAMILISRRHWDRIILASGASRSKC